MRVYHSTIVYQLCLYYYSIKYIKEKKYETKPLGHT